MPVYKPGQRKRIIKALKDGGATSEKAEQAFAEVEILASNFNKNTWGKKVVIHNKVIAFQKAFRELAKVLPSAHLLRTKFGISPDQARRINAAKFQKPNPGREKQANEFGWFMSIYWLWLRSTVKQEPGKPVKIPSYTVWTKNNCVDWTRFGAFANLCAELLGVNVRNCERNAQNVKMTDNMVRITTSPDGAPTVQVGKTIHKSVDLSGFIVWK